MMSLVDMKSLKEFAQKKVEQAQKLVKDIRNEVEHGLWINR